MKSLKPRLLTAVIGIPSLLIFLFVSVYWTPLMNIIIGVASAFMVGEYLNAKKLLKCYPLSAVCMIFSVALPWILTTQYLLYLMVAFVVAGFIIIIACHQKLTYLDLSYSLFGTLLISFGMSCVSVVCSESATLVFYFVTVFLLPWMADAGGFFVGATLGRHKLCPNISPKKTVEGALGGIIFCVGSAVAMGFLFQYVFMPTAQINIWMLAVLGLIDAPISILGDLSFSLIKRSLGVKDYGSIFPGHGGMLDRCDSIIFTAPFIVIINSIIPLIVLG